MKNRSLFVALSLFFFALSAHADWGRNRIEPFAKKGEFAAQGTVSIENVNGKITIETWDRNAYAIEGEKKAKSDEDLALIDLQWDVSAEHIGLKVKLPRKKGWFSWGNVDGQVDITLKIPATARVEKLETVNGGLCITGLSGSLRGSTVNGGIEALGLSGDVRLSTVNGGVRAEFSQVVAGSQLRFETVNGGVKLALPPDAGLTISGSVVNGHIEADIPITLKGAIGKKTLNGTIGDGGARLDVSTVNGSVRITPIDS